jgi:hypothetical protein
MAIASDQRQNLELTRSLSTNNLSIEEFLALPETKCDRRSLPLQ